MYIALAKEKLQSPQSVSPQTKEYWVRQLSILPDNRFAVYVKLLLGKTPQTALQGRQWLINELPWEKWLAQSVSDDHQYENWLRALNEVYTQQKSILTGINTDLPEDMEDLPEDDS